MAIHGLARPSREPFVSGAIDVVKALEPLLRSSGESPDDRCGDSAEGSVE